MEIFEHRYYRLNKTLMLLCGQWPYQSIRVRCVIRVAVLSFAVSHFIPQLIALVKNIKNWNIVMESAVSILFVAFCIAQYSFTIINSQKMLIMLRHIRTNWEVWAQDPDVDILHEYGQKGRKFTIVFLVTGWITCILFVFQPVIPKILDIIVKNGTKPGQFPIPVDYYYVDVQKYYFYIILHSFLATTLAFVNTMTYDCMFFVHVHHACGLFAALGRKLQRIGETKRPPQIVKIAHALNDPYVDVNHLAWCIDRHRDAITYAELIEATYSWCFFVIMGINMLLISLTGIQIFKSTTGYHETIRFIFSNIFCMVTLYIDNDMAQILMDHSISIRYYILNGNWYKLAPKTQKILLFMIIRCNVPCKLTGGKMIILSIETFGIVRIIVLIEFLKSSLSYFTLLRSN